MGRVRVCAWRVLWTKHFGALARCTIWCVSTGHALGAAGWRALQPSLPGPSLVGLGLARWSVLSTVIPSPLAIRLVCFLKQDQSVRPCQCFAPLLRNVGRCPSGGRIDRGLRGPHMVSP